MRSAWRFSIARLLVVTAAIGIAIAGWTKAERLRQERDDLAELVKAQPRTPNEYSLRSQPLTVTLSDQGGMRMDGNWYAAVDFTGNGLVEVRNLMSKDRGEFNVSDSQLAAFRETLIADRFFDLPNEVGDLVPDGSTESITVVVGEYSKTVHIHYLGNLANPSPQTSYRGSQLEAARAVRVWLLARSWFNHPGAFDGRKYARRMLARLDPASANVGGTPPGADGSTND